MTPAVAWCGVHHLGGPGDALAALFRHVLATHRVLATRGVSRGPHDSNICLENV